MSRELWHHGVRVVSVPGGPRPIRTVETAVIGLVGTAPDADPDFFPENQPVLLFGERKKAAKLGTAGTLFNAVDAIFDQIGTAVVVVRVPQATSDQAQMSEIIGGVDPKTDRYTGIAALLTAETKLSVKPRLLIAPGFTATRPSGVARIVLGSANQGTGYKAETTDVSLIGGNGSGAAAQAVIDDKTGAITAITVTNPGFGYSAPPTVSIKDSSGLGKGASATAEIDTVRNPVATELIQVAEKLRAHAFVEGPNTTDEAAVAYRQDFGSRRAYIVDPWVRKWDSDHNSWKVIPGVAHAAGIQARADNEVGFWRSPSNMKVAGIVGIDRDVPWSLTDPNTRANYLNKNGVATFINDKGFYLWGNYTASLDPRFEFLSVSRTDDIIAESIARAHRIFVDMPITRALYEDIATSVNAYLRRLASAGAIIGGECWFDPEDNPPDRIEQGKMLFGYDFSPVYPAQDILFESQITNQYLLEIF